MCIFVTDCISAGPRYSYQLKPLFQKNFGTWFNNHFSLDFRMKANKFSSIEMRMNKYLIFFLLVLLFEIIISTILAYTIGIDRPNLSNVEKVPWYLGTLQELNPKTIFQDSLSFLGLQSFVKAFVKIYQVWRKFHGTSELCRN